MMRSCSEPCYLSLRFSCNDTATTEIYTLSLHDALPISLALAQEVLRNVLQNNDRAVTIEGVQKAVADHYSLRVAELKSRKDRKSTRLNSSHSQISYAVFCLKKKTPCRRCRLTLRS